MMGSLKARVDEHFYGYREIRPINPMAYEMPNPHLIRYVTSGNRQKARDHVAKIYSQVDHLVNEALRLADERRIASDTAKSLIDGFVTSLNSEGQLKVKSKRQELRRAMSAGLHLARLDGSRIGERPPVALGVHIEGIVKIGKQFDDEIAWAAHYVAHQIFYMARCGLKVELD